MGEWSRTVEGMPRARISTGIELDYEDQGAGPPVLLVMGIGAQWIHWPDAFVDALVARGLRVLRYDNRDVGHSTSLDHLGRPPHAGWLLLRGLVRRGRGVPSPYRLDDMATDGVALLDALGLPGAHVVGASMGGMIAQAMTLAHPTRVRSLVSIMSGPGRRRDLGRPKALLALLSGPAPRTPEEAGERLVRLFRVVGSPGFPLEEEGLRALGRRAFERDGGPNRDGFARQMAAIVTSGTRRHLLPTITAPTLVLHGEDDPLIPVRAGRATAALIPGARLRTFPGMGHDLPRALWPALADAIAEHAHAAEALAVPRPALVAAG